MLIALSLVLVFSIPGFAQQTDSRKRLYSASLDGTTGLFKAWDAETLRRGETNWTFGYDQAVRFPGELTIGRATAGLAIGIFDRLEVFESMDVQRHIVADNINFYQNNGVAAPATAGIVNYYHQAAPFMDVPRSTGRSDFHFGLKLNLLSEFRGNPASIGITGFATAPGQTSDVGLKRGLSSGAWQGGLAFLASKTMGDIARLHLNLGSNFYTSPARSNVDFQNEFIYKGGAEFLPYKRIRIITELSAIEYFGDGSFGLNPTTPIDLILGLRTYPWKWLSLGAGYQASFQRSNNDNNPDRPAEVVDASRHGFVVQGALATRRNDPPKLTCAVAKSSILQMDTTTLRANAVDPDGDALTYSWSASGGKVSGTDGTATFDASNIPPGRYTVTANVSDEKHQVSCSSDITVLKRNYAPTASIEPSSAEITQGESVLLRCMASDRNNDRLTYSWAVDGQPLAATGSEVSFGSEGRKPGSYNVTCSASDGEAAASGSSRINVKERIIPNQPPTIECLTTTMDVASGGSIELRARAADPDRDRLSYRWSSTGGSVSGSGETAVFNASGVKAGSHTVSVAVEDGRGGKASCSMTVNVSERLSITREKCGFFAPNRSRLDNCAKAILDDLAVRMKNDPKLAANVIGYTDGSRMEKSKKKLGETRAKAAAKYLEQQGVESSRLNITDGGPNNPVGDNKTAAGRKLNRRVEIEIAVR